MLQPKRVKYRKLQKGRLRGDASRGTKISFGDYGLQAIEKGFFPTRIDAFEDRKVIQELVDGQFVVESEVLW